MNVNSIEHRRYPKPGQSRRIRGTRPAEDGFVLLLVLGLVATFALAGIALLGMTNTEANVASKLPQATKATREADGALDTAVNQIRSDPAVKNADGSSADLTYDCSTAAYANYFTDVTGDTVTFPSVKSVKCATNPPGSATTRDLTISVYSTNPPGSRPFAQARVVITDTAGTGNLASTVPGYTLDVCDWQIGALVTSTVNSC